MKTDISRYSFDEARHFLGVHLQQGRVQLDSDWNEQSELWLRLLQRSAGDAFGTGSPNFGFRIDDRTLIDAMDDRARWTAEPGGSDLAVDVFDHRVGVGSIMVTGATAIVKQLDEPRNWRDLAEVRFAVKGSFAATDCEFFVARGGARVTLPTTELASPLPNQWRLFRAVPTLAAATVLESVEEYGVRAMKPADQYRFDFIAADLPIRRILAPTSDLSGFSAVDGVGVKATLRITDDFLLWRSTALEVTNAASVKVDLPRDHDLRFARRLLHGARHSIAGDPVLQLRLEDNTGATHVLTSTILGTVNGWTVRSYPIPAGPPVNLQRIAAISWTGLTAAVTYDLSPILVEMALDGNLVIMGGDGTSDGAGRFYGDGLAAVKEHHETYLSQRDLPEPDVSVLAPPAANTCRTDLAYLDVSERPVTYLEDPAVREIALQGPDTCTRTQLVAQVRILKGAEVPAGTPAQPPDGAFASLPAIGRGTLTTKDQPAAALDPCADPCEPEVRGVFVGDENRLFRVEIHKAGDVGAARFKWSNENAAVATAIIARAASGTFSAKVEKPEMFAIGDLIEVSDDLADLVTGPYPDMRATRGELRRIRTINITTRVISWDFAGAPDPQYHAALPRDYVLPYHPKIRRWSGDQDVVAGDIVLADGVVIAFGGNDMIPGDFWTFASRVVDRTVERLVQAPPQGVRHRYFPLAHVHRCTQGGASTLWIDDLRGRIRPLSRLDAAGIAFDPGVCEPHDPSWSGVRNVQEALETLCHLEADNDVVTHNKFLHGSGVVCGLKVVCGNDRQHVLVKPGYALECDGHSIHLTQEASYDVVDQATAAQLLDQAGDGEVCLRIQRDVATMARFSVLPNQDQKFLDAVLEGTLLKDFYDECIKNVIDFLKASFIPFIDDTVPVTHRTRRLLSFFNLLYERLNSQTGQYVFLAANPSGDLPSLDLEGAGDHDFLYEFYMQLRLLLEGETFCGIFDDDAPFPDYPFKLPSGIDTAFGLLKFHDRVRLNPDGTKAFTCRGGNQIQMWDLKTQEMVELLTFPAGNNAEVQDVVVSPDGKLLHVVATQNDTDSIIATATLASGQPSVWGSTHIICDVNIVSLAVSSAKNNKDVVYAVARNKGKGFYRFDPLNPPSPFTPLVVPSNGPTGLLHISADGKRAFMGVTSTITYENFEHIWEYPIDPFNAAGMKMYNVSGLDGGNDIITFDTTLHVTGNNPNAPGKAVLSFDLANQTQTGVPVALPENTPSRLAVIEDGKSMLVTLASSCRVILISVDKRAYDQGFRIPVQVMPMGIVTPDAETAVVLNTLSCTLSVIDLPTVVLTPTQPIFTDEPPVQLAEYRAKIWKAYEDLFFHFAQYVKDCFCNRFIIDCPDCQDDDVLLGAIEIRKFKVYRICNLEKRHYAKTFRTYGYWLSAIPILPLIKHAFSEFCCMVFQKR